MNSFQRIIKYVGMGFAILLAISIIGGICTAVFGITGAAKNGKNSKVSATSDVYTFAKFTSMDIDSGVANVTIETGDEYQVETIDVPDTMTVEVKNNGTLVIRTEKDWHNWFNWFGEGSWNKNSRVNITVPEGFEADKIKINSGTGNLEMSDLKTDTLTIDGGVGNITGSNVVAKDFEADAGVGNIHFTEVEFGKCDVQSGVGDVRISGIFNGDCDFDGGVGNLEIEVEGTRTDYDLDIDSGVGSVCINGKKVKDLKEDNDSNKKIKLDGGVGSVDLDFMQD